jgi:plastocyanin
MKFMKTKIFYSGLIAIFLAAILFISCSKTYNSPMNAPATATVSMMNMAFSPATISVAAGTTVTWMNGDTAIHTVTADDGSFNSGNIAMGASFSRVFTSAGTFTYHSALNPAMTGKIVVTASTGGMY